MVLKHSFVLRRFHSVHQKCPMKLHHFSEILNVRGIVYFFAWYKISHFRKWSTITNIEPLKNNNNKRRTLPCLSPWQTQNKIYAPILSRSISYQQWHIKTSFLCYPLSLLRWVVPFHISGYIWTQFRPIILVF